MQGEQKEARLISLRLYRVAFIPALVALIAAMFSLSGIPDPIDPVTPTGSFDGERATATAEQIVRQAPAREPGSSGDAQIAQLVRDRFGEIPAGAVSEQVFEASIDGSERSLINVLLTLPGDAERTILVLAARDSATGEGAVSSAAATGILLELADALGVAGHDSTYLLASTSGGAQGAERLIDSLPESETIETVIVLTQPGAAEPKPPYAVISTDSRRSGPVQLQLTAEQAIETQAELGSSGESGFRQLSRLAFPSGLGAQAPLISRGFDAVAISSAGERPLPAADDELDDLAGRSVDAFGRAAHSLVGAIDLAPPLEHGPATYIELADNLVPGWSLAALALTLLLPVGVAAVDACARVARRGGSLGQALGWAGARCLPFVGGLGLLYGLALVGIVPRPEFPFDPGEFEFGARAAIALALIVIGTLASAYLLRRFGVTGRRAPAGSLAAVGALCTLAALVLWLANPYLALLAVPAAHVWVLADGAGTSLRKALVVIAALLSLIPVIAALASVAGALELGSDAPWTFTLMVADGQIGLGEMFPAALIAGSLAGASALALGGGGRLPATPGRQNG